ncbi:Bug family tripartite tricarboxylate transporter substrate binding protein [Falsiroseomonas sp. CW058]|uniref:Bug family tripartite tricarboxylate transporter substrate binding protein n=1 Tax=Falsiroseomonas sp. CW058 TaxID=3388664 RepID=UPI003D30F9E9
MTSRRRLLAATGAALALPRISAAQEGFPSRSVTIVVPFPPGGGTDVLARILGQHFQEAWRQPVVTENRGGGAGRIGMQIVQRAQPDGHTLMVTSTGGMMGLAGAEHRFVVREHLTPITLVAAPAYVVAMHPGVGARNVGELIALAKSRPPGHFTFGSSGTGAASHLAAELFASMAGIEMLHVPYRGTGPALTDLVAGRIHLMFAPPQTVASAVAAGQVVNLAVTSERRTALLPGLPTAAESGLPGYSAVGWFGLFAPRGVPPAIAERIAADAARALTLRETRERMAGLGAEPEPMTPDAFSAYVDADIAKWQSVVRERNITLE